MTLENNIDDNDIDRQILVGHDSDDDNDEESDDDGYVMLV
jgi:hypothetical protein